MRKSIIPVLTIIISTCLISCIKDFDLRTKTNQPQLVVEAYINNLMPEYNYVVLSRSLDYLSTEFQSSPVSKAGVYITEGEIINNRYSWQESTKTRLVEADLPVLPANFKKGVYFDPRLSTARSSALIGTPGKSYLLEISDGDNQYSAITTLLKPVPLDSVTVGFKYIDTEDSNKVKLRITSHFKDPDTLNNTLLYYYRSADTRYNFGWGGLSKSRNTGTDDLTNGQYMHLTFSRGFTAGDTVTLYMSNVTRDVYNFWDTFTKARDHNGPFATPVTLATNLRGNNVTGCFSGFSLSTQTAPIKER